MAQAIENWAELAGTLREVRPPDGPSQMSKLVIQVHKADDVEGYPNLLADTPGRELAVAIKTAKLDDLDVQPGAEVRCRAQRASPDVVVAHPDEISSR
jgi:hypothetical protein